MSSNHVDVAVIGAGQAGLATSWYLTQSGIDHVVLESGGVAETWRSRRWDSFCLVTPNWAVRLPGASYSSDDPDGFMPLSDLVAMFDSWAESFRAPVRRDSHVSSVEIDPSGGFALTVPDGIVRAWTVVVAAGAYQRAHRPAGAATLPGALDQILAEEYRNPHALPPGKVLIVGSGQTGCQLAEELHEAGRTVFVACGRGPWWPRRLDGRDIVWWTNESGFMDRTPDMLPSPAARLVGNPQMTGHGGGRDLNFRTLHASGVELVGRFLGVEGSRLHFADDVGASVDFGDARWAETRGFIDAYCKRSGTPTPDYNIPPPMRIATRTELDVVREGITTVIWTTGYRPQYSWVKVPVFDDMGFPIQVDGRTSVPGLYFVGVHWLRKNKSAILYGVGEDAQVVVEHIVGSRS